MEQQLVLFPLNRTNNVEGTMIEGNQVAKEIFFGGTDKRIEHVMKVLIKFYFFNPTKYL